MLEIHGEDIKKLDDTDLRELIGLLYEAELRLKSLPTAGVTWGGHQNASDGGIDVRVECASIEDNDGYLPRKNIGIQVKKSKISKSQIIKEMRPNGQLRVAIKELIKNSGSYIIVSGESSTSDSALQERKSSMREAISNYSNFEKLHIDFYDQGRIASWVRNHPSLILWVRNKIGRPISGWSPYDNWSHSPNGVTDKYYIDDHIKIFGGSNIKSHGITVVEGINNIRKKIHKPGKSIRFVGLSGVGKTRLVQALFDENIGEQPLNQSRVFYTDIGDTPSPTPLDFANQIQATGIPAILVIDNCSQDLHRRLTDKCVKRGSIISLITIEYDIKEDQPRETEVIRLEPSSEELIIEILLTRFNELGETNARSIAIVSGGNFRLAISLANTVKSGENLASLKDEELFLRLFEQRHGTNRELLEAAEVLSLVYSFNSFNYSQEGEKNELSFLAGLVDMKGSKIYRYSSKLKRRELVQERGKWRAVLPHALANRLASRALENIPVEKILYHFENSEYERLLKSFSRRLSYLHESDEAREISSKWLAKGGLLGDLSQLNDLGIQLFSNIAPVDQEITLQALERMTKHQDSEIFFSRKNRNYSEFSTVLQSLAYNSELFPRAVKLLIKFALNEKEEENYNSIRNILESLFYLYLSGTHATPQQRLEVIRPLLLISTDKRQMKLGILLLKGALKSYSYHSTSQFDFGARPRDYGYQPRTKEDVKNWFRVFIQYAVELLKANSLITEKVKKLLSEEFSGLWNIVRLYDEMEDAFDSINKEGFWEDGWIAIRTTKAYYKEDLTEEGYKRLERMDRKYSPKKLLEQVKVIVLSNEWLEYEIINSGNKDAEIGEVDNYEKSQLMARALGKDVIKDEGVFNQLVPGILTNREGRLYSFGQGLAEGAKDPSKVWNRLCEEISVLTISERNYDVLCGFINSLYDIDRSLSESILEKATTDPRTSSFFVPLQISVELDENGLRRLHQALDLKASPIWMFSQLAYGRRHENINEKDLSELLRKIASTREGIRVAIDILHMRLHSLPNNSEVSDLIKTLGQELILSYTFKKENNNRIQSESSKITKIIKYCFKGETANKSARKLCENLIRAIENYDIYAMNTGKILKVLASNHTEAYLNSLLKYAEADKNRYFKLRDTFDEIDPISHVDENIIINWCEEGPKERYALIATVIIPYFENKKTKKLEWTGLAKSLISKFDNPIFILKRFRDSFLPRVFSGSLADIYERRLDLLVELENLNNDYVSDWVNDEKEKLVEHVSEIREEESLREKERNERFE